MARGAGVDRRQVLDDRRGADDDDDEEEEEADYDDEEDEEDTDHDDVDIGYDGDQWHLWRNAAGRLAASANSMFLLVRPCKKC